ARRRRSTRSRRRRCARCARTPPRDDATCAPRAVPSARSRLSGWSGFPSRRLPQGVAALILGWARDASSARTRAMTEQPERLHSVPPQAPLRLGVVLFLVSVGVMFVAVLVAYAVTRTSQTIWVSAGVPPGLYVSTVLLAALSFMMHRAKEI